MAMAGAVGLGALLAGHAPAGAAPPIVQSYFFSTVVSSNGAPAAPDTNEIEFQQFNPALGTLSSITIAYSFFEVGGSSSALLGISGGVPVGESSVITLGASGIVELFRGMPSVEPPPSSSQAGPRVPGFASLSNR
jgi:hypothetical protein